MINLAAPPVWRSLRVFRCFSGEKKCELDAPKHTHARALLYIYIARECVSAAHSPSVYIYIYPYLHTVWVFRVKWCLSSFFREAHTTGTLSRIIWASCPASHSILFGNNIHVACMRAIPPEYISTSFWPALSASFVLFLVLYTISHSSITFCRRHFCKVCRCTDRVCFFSLFPALFLVGPVFLSISFSRSYSYYIFTIISLLSRQSITWYAGTLSMHCLHRVMILWLCCLYQNIYILFWVRH